ncbi:hypothetical protein EUGRSUZ_F01014 [Eucalyptus grandis]|uniref:Uncharacterized protein n=2 Tax=Eucalyptus grandis TaxID=71139 RepID=A0ACC3KDN2_EUCGR|nr:hypothetical protein EUGRSUZ_F01014 [Eucalyptus grandis]
MDELETWCRKAKRIKGEQWSVVQSFGEGRSLSPQQVERLDDLSKEVEDILAHNSFQRGSTTCAAGYRKSSPLHDYWSLLSEKLHFEKLPSEVEKIARSIMDKCGGLPLGIIEIATPMRGVEEVHKWKDLLEDLTESFIDEGLLGGIATRQELYDQCNTILGKIRKACLWDNLEEEVPVHPLIRDMTLQTVTSITHMNKACWGLKDIPQEDYWTVHLEKVFLQGNKMEQIPYSISPNCPKLTRLLLGGNVKFEFIHKSFFRHLNGLKVLDLRNTRIIELPDPICYLESLEALLLQWCTALCRISYLGKLGSLRKLDLKGCAGVEKMPEGLEMLVELTYLDLDGTKIEMLPEGVLGKLGNLQYLAIQEMGAGEEAKLKKMEALYCCVPDVETTAPNSSLALNVLVEDYRWHDQKRHIIIDSCGSVAARVDGGISGDGCALLPKNVQVLDGGLCDGLTSFCDMGPLEILEVLKIYGCDNLEELGPLHFPHLRSLNVTGCSRLKLEEGQGLPRINIAAASLQNISVGECPKMKRAVEWEWLTTCLPNPECITTCYCEKLEEMIGVEECEGIEVIIGTVPNMTPSSFPDLTCPTLWDLPKLRSICDGMMAP